MKILHLNMDCIHIIAYVMKEIRMCANRDTWIYPSWNTSFYQQYLQQHARMTQWIQNLHQNLPQPWQCSSNHGNHTCCHHNHHQNQQLPDLQQAHYIPPQGHPAQHQRAYLARHREHSRRNSHYDTQHRSRSQTSVEYTNGDENEVLKEDDEGDESDGELVLNVDAILAFRAAKEVSEEEEKAVSEESFELVEAVLDENFEFVELNDAGQLQKMYGRPSVPDAKGDVEYDREARLIMYGDRSDRIGGLETSLEIMFDHISDLHQPVVYPHV